MRLSIAILSVIITLTGACSAQTRLQSPVTVTPVAPATGGEIKIMAPNNVDFADIQTTVNALIVKGKTANNGNIVLQPGNVAGGNLAGVYVVAPRSDSPGLVEANNFGAFDTVNIADRAIYSLAGNASGKTIWAMAQSSNYGLLKLSDSSGSGGFDGNGAQTYCIASGLGFMSMSYTGVCYMGISVVGAPSTSVTTTESHVVTVPTGIYIYDSTGLNVVISSTQTAGPISGGPGVVATDSTGNYQAYVEQNGLGYNVPFGGGSAVLFKISGNASSSGGKLELYDHTLSTILQAAETSANGGEGIYVGGHIQLLPFQGGGIKLVCTDNNGVLQDSGCGSAAGVTSINTLTGALTVSGSSTLTVSSSVSTISLDTGGVTGTASLTASGGGTCTITFTRGVATAKTC